MIPDYGIDEYFDDTISVKGVVHVLVAINIRQQLLTPLSQEKTMMI